MSADVLPILVESVSSFESVVTGYSKKGEWTIPVSIHLTMPDPILESSHGISSWSYLEGSPLAHATKRVPTCQGHESVFK